MGMLFSGTYLVGALITLRVTTYAARLGAVVCTHVVALVTQHLVTSIPQMKPTIRLLVGKYAVLRGGHVGIHVKHLVTPHLLVLM